MEFVFIKYSKRQYYSLSHILREKLCFENKSSSEVFYDTFISSHKLVYTYGNSFVQNHTYHQTKQNDNKKRTSRNAAQFFLPLTDV